MPGGNGFGRIFFVSVVVGFEVGISAGGQSSD